MIDKCHECDSWNAECSSEVPIHDCRCARCACAMIERLKQERDYERSQANNAIEAASVGEWVIAAIRGEKVPDFAESFSPVLEAQALRAERDTALANYQFMVDRAMNEKLDGYRELGARAAAAENARDAALAHAQQLQKTLEACKQLPFEHTDGTDCPTFYDGCNCTLECLRDALAREEVLQHENDKLTAHIRELEWAEAEAMALVLNHEGHIERLEAALTRIRYMECQRGDDGLCLHSECPGFVAYTALAGRVEEKMTEEKACYCCRGHCQDGCRCAPYSSDDRPHGRGR